MPRKAKAVKPTTTAKTKATAPTKVAAPTKPPAPAKAASVPAKVAKRAKPAKTKAPSPVRKKVAPAFYFDCGQFDPKIDDIQPEHTPLVVSFATFEEAKDRAVDALIDLIDHCEKRLWQLKRAENFTEYQKLCANE